MDELDLPSRLFETGFEPTGRKRVNNYFNLRWIEVIKGALEADDLAMLNASQFGQVLKMGSHTFSVVFLHYILARQLETEKDFELWWLFVGKPIRYAIQDFALVTGLNCGEIRDAHREATDKAERGKGTGKVKSSTSSTSIWDTLFRGEEKPTTSWIIDRLSRGKKYKDPLTRLRLALLVLVEGILCPTCGTTIIRPQVVRMLGNLDEFLEYPWGRESFLLTVRSTKSRSPKHYVLQDTMAIQGFSHAMVLVTVAACPTILLKSGEIAPLDDETRSSEEIVHDLIARKFAVNLVSAKAVDQKGQAYVRSLLNTDEDAEVLYRALGDKEDGSVEHMVELLAEDYPFEHNIWSGGVRADDVMKAKTGHPVPVDSSEWNESCEMEKEYGHQGGGDGGVRTPEARGEPFMSHEEAHIGGRSTSAGVPNLVRQAAEAYESHLLPMFEGYMVSIKEHISSEFSKLKTEVESTKSSMLVLENYVKNEFATMRNASSISRMYGEEPDSGYSPQLHSFPPGDSNPASNTKKCTVESMGKAQDPSLSEVEAAGGEKSAPTEKDSADPQSDGHEVLCEPTVTHAMPPSSLRVDYSHPGSEAHWYLYSQLNSDGNIMFEF